MGRPLRTTVLVSVLPAGAMVAACTLTTSFDGLLPEPRDTSAPDADGSVRDATVSDGSLNDAGSGDGTVTSDAASGDSTTPPSFCANLTAPHTYCEDFDDGTDLTRFTVVQSPGLTIDLDTAAVSAPNALHAVAPGVAAAEKVSAFARLPASTTGTGTAATLSFDLRIDKANDASFIGVQVAQLSFVTASASLIIELGFGGTERKAFLARSDRPSFDRLVIGRGAALPVAKWAHVDMTVTLRPGGAGFDYKATVDAVPFAESYSDGGTVPSGAVRAEVGIVLINGQHNGWDVRVDNVYGKVN
jgi:hypothetical protein